MTSPAVGPEQRREWPASDDDRARMALNAAKRNAEMRGEPYTTQPRTPEETAGFLKNNPPAEPTIQDIHRRLNAENIDLRGQLEMARKATGAAQELLEAERAKVAALTESRQAVHNDAMRLLNEKQALRADLDTEKLLRVNHVAAIEGLQLRLKEAEAQLRAQRLSPTLMGPAIGMMEIPAVLWRERMAENAELRRTISLMAKTAAEVQNNFRLIAELAADPADEARTRTTP